MRSIIFFMSLMAGFVALGDSGVFGQAIQESAFIKSLIDLIKQVTEAIKSLLASFGNVTPNLPALPDHSDAVSKVIDAATSVKAGK